MDGIQAASGAGHEPQQQTPTTIAQAAAEYARAGWSLVKLPPRSKGDHGMGKSWNLRKNAVTDPDDILGWRGNFGALLAYCGLVALDVDDEKQAALWFKARGVDYWALKRGTEAVAIVSGQPNHYKLLFRVPPSVDPLSLLTHRIHDEDGHVILEFRCAGQGDVSVQDVLPPSVHPKTGEPYRWEGEWRAIALMPGWLLKLWHGFDSTARPRGERGPLGDGSGAEIRDVFERLQRAGCKPFWTRPGDIRAHCPVHFGESGDTFHINEAADGRLLLHCFADCAPEDVFAALGMGPGPEVKFGSSYRGYGVREDSVDDDADCARGPWLREVPLAGVATAPPVGVSFAFEPILPRGEVTILGGHGGAGKSICALCLAVAAACGETWCGFAPDGPLKVAYVSLEDHGDIVLSRVRNILRAARLSPQRMEGGLRMFDGSDGETALAVEVSQRGVRTLVMTAHWRELAESCAGADIIVIDNASDAYAADENNRSQVRSFMRHLRALARQSNAALLLLCHIDKSAARGSAQGNSYSGSTAWHNASRSRLALIPNSDGTVLLVHERSSHRKAAEPITLGWTDTGILLPLTASQRAAAIARDAEDLLVALARVEQLGIRIPTAERGASTSWQAVSNLPGLPPWLTGKEARRRFRAALLWLAEAGAVIRILHPDGHGHKREFWKLAQPAEVSE